MSNNKQSSVEWLMEIDKSWSITIEEWQQAKAIHKEEMCQFAFDYYDEYCNNGIVPPIQDYYNEYFNTKDK